MKPRASGVSCYKVLLQFEHVKQPRAFQSFISSLATTLAYAITHAAAASAMCVAIAVVDVVILAERTLIAGCTLVADVQGLRRR